MSPWVYVCVHFVFVSGLVSQRPFSAAVSSRQHSELSGVIHASCHYWWRARPSGVLCHRVLLPLRQQTYQDRHKVNLTTQCGPDVDWQLTSSPPAAAATWTKEHQQMHHSSVEPQQKDEEGEHSEYLQQWDKEPFYLPLQDQTDRLRDEWSDIK